MSHLGVGGIDSLGAGEVFVLNRNAMRKMMEAEHSEDKNRPRKHLTLHHESSMLTDLHSEQP